MQDSARVEIMFWILSAGFSLGPCPFCRLIPWILVSGEEESEGFAGARYRPPGAACVSLLSRQGRVEAVHPELAGSVFVPPMTLGGTALTVGTWAR